MLRWLMRRVVVAFERQWNYDAAYLHEMDDSISASRSSRKARFSDPSPARRADER
ncbi:MAG: hypothetical protein H0X67_04560 [Acidobacteria bacterium]|nr:hypothetical protein [Acidobacteriota bacterium]